MPERVKLSELLEIHPDLPYAMAVRAMAAAMDSDPSYVIEHLERPLADAYSEKNNHRYPFGDGRELERFSASLFNFTRRNTPLLRYLDFGEIAEIYPEFIGNPDNRPYSFDPIRAAFRMVEFDTCAAIEIPRFETDGPESPPRGTAGGAGRLAHHDSAATRRRGARGLPHRARRVARAFVRGARMAARV